ncbi:MAG: 50S ribosomal protein L18 [Chitinispirillaceae bacterium]
MDKAKQRIIERKNRAARVRKKITGDESRPRLCIRRSLKHFYAQIIDDTHGKSIVQVGSRGKEMAEKVGDEKVTKSDLAKMVGELIGQKAREHGVEKVVFDRKGYTYHGRIKAFADGARSSGLIF